MDLQTFVLNGLKRQITEKSVPESSIRLNAVGWYEKGVLTETDLEILDAAFTTMVTGTETNGGNENEG